jgi:uncharacterized cupredoxin-like copper-binding protein
MNHRHRRGALVALVAIPLMAAGCGGNSSGETGSPGSPAIKVQQRDFKITLSSTTVKTGKITFDVKNTGPSTHEFVVFRTDLESGKLPTKADGTVDESGAGVTHIDEIEDIEKGKSKKLDLDLPAGKYVVLCNLVGHYAAGMHTPLTVTG